MLEDGLKSAAMAQALKETSINDLKATLATSNAEHESAMMKKTLLAMVTFSSKSKSLSVSSERKWLTS